MASSKKNVYQLRHNDNKAVLRVLNELYGKSLHISIIESVAKSQQWQLEKTCCILSEMSENITSSDRSNNRRRSKSQQKMNSVAYSTAEDNDADVLVETGWVANRNALPRKKNPPVRNKGPAPQKTTDPLEKVHSSILSGNRVMILLRGLPGSGKSHLAQQIVFSTVPQHTGTFIFSTDDFFAQNATGTYIYNPTFLAEAHGWNQQRVFAAAKLGLSPIIVDNTHTQAWEMKPYVHAAANNGYLLITLEPRTPWAFNVSELAKRNRHAVPKQKIVDMHHRYEHNVTGPGLFAMFNIQYPSNMRPPQKRAFPAFERKKRVRPRKDRVREHVSRTSVTATSSAPEPQESNDQLSDETWDSDNDGTWESVNSDIPHTDLLSSENMEYVLVQPDNTLIYQRTHESNETQDLINFNDENQQSNKANSAQLLEDVFGSSPNVSNNLLEQFKLMNVDNGSQKFSLSDFGQSDDWKIDPWLNKDSQSGRKYSTELLQQMESQEVATNTNSSDFQLTKDNYSGNIKILYGTGRDILENMQVVRKDTIPPRKLMLDKGTTTEASTETPASSNNQHLRTLFSLFPQVKPDVLQDIFDKCQGDVNWAVDLLLECNQELNEAQNNVEDYKVQTFLDSQEKLISEPKINSVEHAEASTNIEDIRKIETGAVPKVLKSKNVKSDDLLKRHIEEQFKIGDEHYSERLLNLRRRRHGEVDVVDDPVNMMRDESDVEAEVEEPSNESSSEEELVELTLGDELVNQLETQFGRAEAGTNELPTGFQPVVQLPASMARQLHALWLQSVCTQWRAHSTILQDIERKDRELAKILQQREEQHIQKQPDLQEIMDMEIALAVYRTDQQQWQRETPDDLASRMTRQKLFEAFPELDRTLLTEILQAHGNSFENTVQALLCSLGRTECETLKSVEGRIVPRENDEEQLVRQLESAKSEPPLEWSEPKGKTDELSAEEYRDEAAHHLTMRQKLLNKANECAQKGMPQVASYYSEVARLHMNKYELANGRAACAFLSEHQSQQSSHTLDLHFLYVREAEQALALFLDNQISRLKNSGRGYDTIFIITGRGNRSAGGISHLKPAVKKRLRERKLNYVEMNPGLLRVLVTKHSLLTNDLKNNTA